MTENIESTPPLPPDALDLLQRLWESFPREQWDSCRSGNWPEDNHCWGIYSDRGTGVVAKLEGYGEEARVKSAFIAATHNAFPALLSRLRSDAEKIERLEEVIRRCCQCRFENGEQYEECHLHECQRSVCENGDPTDVTLEAALTDRDQRLERLQSENDRIDLEKSELMVANGRQIKIMRRLREALKGNPRPQGAVFNDAEIAAIEGGA